MPYKDKKTKLLKAKMIYDERKIKGLCVACGEKNDTPERVYCSFCAKKREMARKRYKNACDYHDCLTCPYPYCKSNEKLENKRYKKALENIRKTFPETNRKWKEAGLCERCGGEIEPEMKGHTCRKCRDKQNAISRRYYRNHHILKSHNPELCSRCHKKYRFEGKKVCYDCLIKMREVIKKTLAKRNMEDDWFKKSNHIYFVTRENNHWKVNIDKNNDGE